MRTGPAARAALQSVYRADDSDDDDDDDDDDDEFMPEDSEAEEEEEEDADFEYEEEDLAYGQAPSEYNGNYYHNWVV